MGFFKRKKKIEGKPLVDIIGLALYKPTYRELVSRIEKGQPLDGLMPRANTERERKHRAKILDEEATKPFSHRYQPVIQMIVNSIEARPASHQGDYFVDIKVTGKMVEITDSGKGMDIEKILTVLLTPFSSDKEEGKDIGRMGVGFFSGLGYCLSDPGSALLDISTAGGGTNYRIGFGSASEDVNDLLCSIGRGAGSGSGTTAKLKFKHGKKQLVEYISDYLSFFDPGRAKIRVNGKVVNQPDERSGEVEYRVPVDFGDGQESCCRLRFGCTGKNGKNSLYSQGVLVNSNDFPHYDIKVDFPPAVLPVEGRDEFKQDEKYTKSVKGLVEYVCRHSKEIRRDMGPDFDVNEFLASMVEASDMPGHTFSRLLEGNIRSLFKEGTHVIEDYDRISHLADAADFLGDSIRDVLYAPQTLGSFIFWRNILPGFLSLLHSRTQPSDVLPDELLESCPGLGGIARELANTLQLYCISLHLVTISSQDETRSPFMREGKRIYLNVEHPLLADDSFLSRYMVTSYFGRIFYGEVRSDEVMIHY